jgi:hypothetical protein
MDRSSGTNHDDKPNSSGSHQASDPPNEESEKKSNFNVACLGCRAVKTRCQNAGIGVKCSRCLRLKVPCEYREHRRGRRSAKPDRQHIVPPIVPAREPEDTKPRPEPSSPPLASPTYGSTDRHGPLQPTSPFGFQHQDFPYSSGRISDLRNQPRSPTTSTHRMDLIPDSQLNTQRPTTSASHDHTSPASNSTDSVSLSLSAKRPRIRDYSIAGRLKTPAGLLEPERQKEEDGDDADHWRDPVSMGILSEADAAHLVHSFFTHLNPFIALLDSALHTTTYLRHQSSLLFSSVLAVTAKLCVPNIKVYRELLSVAKRLLNEAMASDMCSLELIQSLSILCFWKECDDPTAWRKIGLAIRMAFELDLHLVDTWSHTKLVDGQADLPEDEIEARELLNCERAWIQLVCFDRTIS